MDQKRKNTSEAGGSKEKKKKGSIKYEPPTFVVIPAKEEIRVHLNLYDEVFGENNYKGGMVW